MSAQTLSSVSDVAKEIISYDPATAKEIARVSTASHNDVVQAVAQGHQAQPVWANLSFRERGRVVMKAREIVLRELDEIALLISRETGKPVAEAIAMELVPTLDLMRYFAGTTEKLLRPQKIDIGQYGLMGRSSRIVYKPVGVVGIISPWNFPWATPLDEVVMALMAGNAVVLKPSELTPLTGLKIKDVFDRAGLPKYLLHVVNGDGQTGAALVTAGADKLMFTGSVETGKRVAEAAAKTLTPVVLELGGKDPMIVLEDADLEMAARAAVWGAFANAGQCCASVERCYVHERIASRFIDLVTKETNQLKQNVGTASDTDVGAMSSERQLAIVVDHVDDAVAKGAHVVSGGGRTAGLAGSFYQPTVLTEVDHEMEVMCEETFGPVLPIMTFKDEAEAVRWANDSRYGLTASVWTKDIARGKRLAEQIDAGTVMVNEVLYTHGIAQAPWGGMKQSGIGRTHGRMGLLELVVPKHIHVNRITFLPDLWWFNYKGASRLFRALATNFTTGSVLKTTRLLPRILKRLFGAR